MASAVLGAVVPLRLLFEAAAFKSWAAEEAAADERGVVGDWRSAAAVLARFAEVCEDRPRFEVWEGLFWEAGLAAVGLGAEGGWSVLLGALADRDGFCGGGCWRCGGCGTVADGFGGPA